MGERDHNPDGDRPSRVRRAELDPVTPAVLAAITALVAEHAHRLDHGEADRLWELYVEDCALIVPPDLGLGDSVFGRAALQAWSAARAAKTDLVTLHVCTNLRVWSLGEGRVGARCAAVVYRCTTPDDDDAMTAAVTPALVSEYDDVCELGRDDRWRFVSRRALPVFIGPELRERARHQSKALERATSTNEGGAP